MGPSLPEKEVGPHSSEKWAESKFELVAMRRPRRDSRPFLEGKWREDDSLMIASWNDIDLDNDLDNDENDRMMIGATMVLTPAYGRSIKGK